MEQGERDDGRPDETRQQVEPRGARGEGLTGTDLRLLQLLRGGASGSEAAVDLGLSPREVATRVRDLRERWGVTSTRRLLELLPPGSPAP